MPPSQKPRQLDINFAVVDPLKFFGQFHASDHTLERTHNREPAGQKSDDHEYCEQTAPRRKCRAPLLTARGSFTLRSFPTAPSRSRARVIMSTSPTEIGF